MAKVRYSKRGACGCWLPHGSAALRLHGGLWCYPCVKNHRTKHPDCPELASTSTSGGGLLLKSGS